MARPVYSVPFLTLGALNESVAYVVPAANVAIVKAVTMVYLGGPTAANALVSIRGTNTPICQLVNVHGQDQLQFQTHQVVEAGERITIAASAANTCYISVSGYLLTAL